MPLAFVILPVLIPINLYGGRGSVGAVSGLDRISWTNVASNRTDHYWAHLCLSLVVVLWVCRIFWYETDCYTRLRQKRMVSQLNQASGTTVLVTDIPQHLQSPEDLKSMYNIYPGGVRNVWCQRDYSRLTQKIQERDMWVSTLEAAETRLLQRVQSLHQASKGQVHNSHPGQPLWMRYLSQDKREHCTLPAFGISWLPSLPYIGKRVDVIDHCRERLATLNAMILQEQKSLTDFKVQGSALVQFNKPLGAHMACRSVHHPSPHRMASKQVEETSRHIIWRNVSMGWYERYVRTITVGALIVSLCFACIFPVAFTGLLSQLNYLASIWPHLSWLMDLPGWLQGVLQGVLPPCLLAAITIILPIILERLILEQGVHTDTTAELLLQDYYFGFLFLQLFLVISVSSSVAAILDGLSQDFESLAASIALNLPKAGNYFFSYIILQGLSVSAGALLRLPRLLGCLSAPLWDNTAREKWKRSREPQIRWGTFFPVYTNLAAIGLIYSVVSPLILVFNIVTFCLFLLVQEYNVVNVARFNTDTGGLIYPKAINQLFTGLYVMELYLIGLFFLVRDEQNRAACIGQGVIMIFVLCITIIYQTVLNHAYDPLLKSLPVMLSDIHSAEELTRGSESSSAFPILQALDRLEVLNTILGRCIKIPQINTTGASVEFDEVKDDALHAAQPVVWLPKDYLGISDDEIKQTQRVSKDIKISNDNANLDSRAKVHIYGPPPENDEHYESA